MEQELKGVLKFNGKKFESISQSPTDGLESQKFIHTLLNPLIYNKRNIVVFHIFNPIGIVLTAFILYFKTRKAWRNSHLSVFLIEL
jgi:hypothetical protein